MLINCAVKLALKFPQEMYSIRLERMFRTMLDTLSRKDQQLREIVLNGRTNQIKAVNRKRMEQSAAWAPKGRVPNCRMHLLFRSYRNQNKERIGNINVVLFNRVKLLR